MPKLTNDLSIRLIGCKAGDQTFTLDFLAGSQGDMQVMCYLLSLILEGKGVKFGPLDAKSIMEEFQEDYYRALKTFPTIKQWEMEFSIEIDFLARKQKHFCKFANIPERNVNIELLCVQSDHAGMRIDFHATDDENLKNACHFIYMVLRGKGANQGVAYVNTIYEQFAASLLEQKKQDVRIQVDDVSFMYAVLYETSDQKFVCYMS